MKKDLLFLVIIAILLAVGILTFRNFTKEKAKSPMPEELLENKNIAMIIAFRDFKDDEYFIPRNILEENGAKIVTVSDKPGTALGVEGGEVEVDVVLDDLNNSAIAEYDAIVLIGGPGAIEHLDNEQSYSIIKTAFSKNLVIGAICVSPSILAKAGILQGKRATVWSNTSVKSLIKVLQDNGAAYEEKSVVIDGTIITGNGPQAAELFGESLVKLIK